MLLAMLLAAAPAMFAQGNFSVSGNVVDTEGNPVIGVFVTADGQRATTMTDNDGNFSLSVPAKTETLTFSMLGMKDATVSIGKESYFKVVMENNSEFLDAAVSVGYGTIIRRDLASSVSSVKSDQLVERVASYNVTQALAGKVAGYSVYNTSGRPGGANTVTIRGRGSINSSYTPLYVVDGVVDVDIDMINAADIENIEVLKDAASTAMYGAKGANGVIIVTTKNGARDSGTVSFSTTHGVNFVGRTYKQLDSQDNIDIIRECFAYSGERDFYHTNIYDKFFTYETNPDGSYKTDAAGLYIPHPKYNADWQKDYYNPGYVTDNTLSFSKADGKNTIYASLGYKDINGVLYNTYARRFNGMVNFSSKITKWLDFKAGANFSSNTAKRNDSNLGDIFFYIPFPGPATFIPFQYEDGSYGYKYENNPWGKFSQSTSDYEVLQALDRIRKNDQVVVNGALDFHIVKGLNFSVKGDYNLQVSNNYDSCPPGLVGVTSSNNGFAQMANYRYTRWSNEDYFTYDNVFFDGKLKSNFVLGTSLYFYNAEQSNGEQDGFSDFFGYYNMGTGTTMVAAAASTSQKTMHSVYFRTNQAFLGRYLLGITLRADGASNFGTNNKYGFFPSASLGWVISEEPWFANAKETISHLKIRASYGTVGNSNISPYETFAQVSEGTIIFNKQQMTTAYQSRLANGDLKWEEATQIDAGFDLSLWKDRVNLMFDFYNRDTHNMLYEKQIPTSTGYSTSLSNLGLLRNTGFEITLNTHLIDHKIFKWDLDFIFSDNITRAVDINGDVLYSGISGDVRTAQGEEWQRIWVYQRAGIWQLDEVQEAAKYGYHPGDAKYVDQNGDGVLDDDDRIYVGRITPRNEFTLVNTFHIGPVSLMIDLMAKTGFYTYGGIWATTYLCGGDNDNNRYSANFAWTPNNQATMWIANRTSSSFVGELSDDYSAYRADYLQIRNISLGYDIKSSLLKNNKFFKGMSLLVNAENVATFTKAPIDRLEAQSWGSNGFYSGNYPAVMTITGTLKLSF